VPGAALFLALAGWSGRGAWGYLFRHPGAFDGRSVRILLQDALLPLAAAAALLALAVGLGRTLLRRLGVEEDGLLAFGLGLGAFASAVFLAGLSGFYGLAAFAVLGLASAWGLRGASWRPALPAGGPLLGGLLAFCALHAFVIALAPATEWDVLAYHLALPELYLRAGRVLEAPWLLHSHWPHLLEALYGVPLALGMEGAAALLHAAACAALVYASYRCARERLGAQAAWLAAALLASQPVLLRFAGTAHSDGGFALFHLLACLALWSWEETGSRGRLAAGGLLSGFAASAKLLGAVPTAALALWVLSRSWKRERSLRPALLFAACAGAVVAPWYLKSWLWAGDPFWPFLSGGFDAYRQSNLFSGMSEAGLALRYGPQYLLVPAAGFAAWAALRRWEWPPFLKFLLLPAVPYSLAVALHHEGWRFMLPMYPALALSAAWGASRMLERGGLERAAAAALLLFGLSPVLGAATNNALFPVLGLRSSSEPAAHPRELYLDRLVDVNRFYREMLPELPPQSKVLLFREVRGYRLKTNYLWGDPLNQGLIRYARLDGPEALLARLRELKVTHVLVNEDTPMYRESPGYYDRRTLEMMAQVLSDAREVRRRGKIALYRLGE